MCEVILYGENAKKHFRVVINGYASKWVIVPIREMNINIKNIKYGVNMLGKIDYFSNATFDLNYELFSMDRTGIYIADNELMSFEFETEEDAFYFKLKYDC